VLLGLDFRICMPSVIMVESENPKHERQIDDILLPAGYCKSLRIAQNAFYVSDRAFTQRVKGRVFLFTLRHTALPVEGGGGDKRVPCMVDARWAPCVCRSGPAARGLKPLFLSVLTALAPRRR